VYWTIGEGGWGGRASSVSIRSSPSLSRYSDPDLSKSTTGCALVARVMGGSLILSEFGEWVDGCWTGWLKGFSLNWSGCGPR